jgi:predicted nucleic acid-binding protein
LIILDTNVVSEPMRLVPSARVMDWLSRQPVEELCTTAVTKGEVLSGIARMPAGRRRRELEAEIYGEMMAERYATGRIVGELDVQIAAIARLHGATLATRNIADFEDCGIRLVNPWEA